MTLYVIARNPIMAARHAASMADLCFTDQDEASRFLEQFSDPEIRSDFHVYAVEDGPGEHGKIATLIDKIGEAAACLLLIIGGAWASGAFSLWERVA